MRDLTEEERRAFATAAVDAPSPDIRRADIDARCALPERCEWGTFALIVVCYLIWGAAVFGLAQVSLLLAIPVAGLMVVLYSSLSHGVLHGHPFSRRSVNEALVFLPLNLCVPYGRFRDTHLLHHQDENLTDPYDDPESNFQDPQVWARLPAWHRRLLRLNNTLLGRMVLGPLIGQFSFMRADWTLIRQGQTAVLRDWTLHAVGAVVVLGLVSLSAMPIWAYGAAAYLGLAVLKIRTYL